MKTLKYYREYRLAEHGSQLWGHEDGRLVRSKIETVLDTLSAGEVLAIQLHGVQVMDFSFSGEVFGKLIGSLATSYPGRGLILANPSQYVKSNLNAALDAMNLMALMIDDPGGWEVIGRAAETDRETLRALNARGKVTAPELAEDLRIKLTTCNQRLRKLIENGIIMREKSTGSAGGEQFVYRWLG